MSVIKKPDLTDPKLRAKLAKGMGHNYYGEPAWPNDLLYVFPICMLGTLVCIVGLAVLFSFVKLPVLIQKYNPNGYGKALKNKTLSMGADNFLKSGLCVKSHSLIFFSIHSDIGIYSSKSEGANFKLTLDYFNQLSKVL